MALVRFRKAVNAHNTEVARLLALLHAAQGGEERIRLTSELEAVSDRYSLDDMEDVMHREVGGSRRISLGEVVVENPRQEASFPCRERGRRYRG